MKRNLLNAVKSVLMLAFLFPALSVSSQNTIPPKGTVFNESELTTDSITGRKLLKVTKNREFNQTPTYHIHTGFSADSRFLVFASWNKEGQSAIMKADVTTGDITVVAVTAETDPARFNGNNVCMIPASGKAAAVRGGNLYAYDLATLEEKLLLQAGDGFGFGHPTGSSDGKRIYITKMPRFRLGVDDPIPAASSVYYEVEIATGKSREIFRDNSRSNHTVVCPANPDLLLLDRDLPPKYGHGGDGGQTSRVWLLNIKTGKLTEIRPLNPHRFQIHSNWSADGTRVYYHGVSQKHDFPDGFTGKPHYIGVADTEGNVLWEKIFPNFYYGHICSHTTRNTIITDGLLFEKLITEIDWQKTNSQGIPEIKILGAHNSGKNTFGQHTHPHCLVSPDGKYLSYNKGSQDKSDVFVLTLE